MAKTVQLSEESYALLKSQKREGESFSQVVKRLVAPKKDLRKLLELGPRIPGWDSDEAREQRRQADLARLRDLWGDPQ